jgi:hypothetical protein
VSDDHRQTVIDLLLSHCTVIEECTDRVRHLVPTEDGDDINSAIYDLRYAIDECLPDDLPVPAWWST